MKAESNYFAEYLNHVAAMQTSSMRKSVKVCQHIIFKVQFLLLFSGYLKTFIMATFKVGEGKYIHPYLLSETSGF